MCHYRRYEYVTRVRDDDDVVRSSPDLRASQAEREEVVERLRVHTGGGRLELDELEDRVEAAYAAKTRGELAELLSDLPEPPATRLQRRSHPSGGPPRIVLLLLAIAVFAFAPASVAWLGWVLIGLWFFAGPRAGRGYAACGPGHAPRPRERRRTVVV
jgi:hypothetical protein